MTDKKRVLVISGDARLGEGLKARLRKFSYEICLAKDLAELKDHRKNGRQPHLIVYDLDFRLDESEDLIQNVESVKRALPSIEILGTFTHIPDFDALMVLATGVTHVLQLPFEYDQLLNLIFERVPVALPPESLTLDALTRVDLPDLDSMSELPFDLFIYLSVNNRVVFYRRIGDRPDQEWIEKNLRLGSRPLFVRKSDLARYRSFRATRMADIATDRALSTRERSSLLRREASSLLSGVLSLKDCSESDGQIILDTARKITVEFLGKVGSNKGLYDHILALISQNRTNHNHAVNVSAYCAIFGLMANLPDYENLSIGGLLHDIGTSELPPEIASKLEVEMTGDDVELYHLHPFHSVDVVAKRKIPLPESVLKMLVQHHEHTDGSGFPHGLEGSAICDQAKICSFADVFDELTSVKPGYTSYTPAQALQKIAGLKGEVPSPIFDPKFHGPLVDLLLQSQIELRAEPEELIRKRSPPRNSERKAA